MANNGRMSAGKNSKHINNRFFLITDKVFIGYPEIQHKGTDEIWTNVNTKPTQGKRFRFICGHVMGIPEDYYDNVELRRTYLLFLPKIESERLSAMHGEVLEKSAIIVPAKRPTKRANKIKNVSSPPRAMPVVKRRSVLGEGKYSPGVGPAWKAGSSRFSAFYNALVNEPDPGVRKGIDGNYLFSITTK